MNQAPNNQPPKSEHGDHSPIDSSATNPYSPSVAPTSTASTGSASFIPRDVGFWVVVGVLIVASFIASVINPIALLAVLVKGAALIRCCYLHRKIQLANLVRRAPLTLFFWSWLIAIFCLFAGGLVSVAVCFPALFLMDSPSGPELGLFVIFGSGGLAVLVLYILSFRLNM